MSGEVDGGRLGTLYVVATPIGNLEDLSERVRRVLAEVDLIASEDTRRTQTLLAHLGLRTPLESYFQHTERERAPGLIARLQAGKSVALVSDAGVPVISDPGAHLLELAWQAGIRVCPVPGPSAITSLLSVSGFPGDRFCFAGYPPRKVSERVAFYRGIGASSMPTVLFEAPHRIRESLDDAMSALGGERLAVIGRELTKQFEEIRRGPLAELRAHYDEVDPLGEFTIVVAGAPEGAAEAVPARGDVERAARLLLDAGVPTKAAAEIVAAASGLARNDAYDLVLRLRRGTE